jgi:hypothetical protein
VYFAVRFYFWRVSASSSRNGMSNFICIDYN